MPLNYHYKNTIDTVLARQNAYSQWCFNVSAAIQSNDHAAATQSPRPDAFLSGIKDDIAHSVAPEHVAALDEQNTNLFKCADALLSDPQNAETHADFLRIAAQFFDTLSHTQKTVFYSEGGYDPVTKLKNHARMYRDLKVEMERLSRQGMNFSLALAVINGYEDIKASSEDKALEAITMASAAMITCLRPFDDAYYWGENEFILCLKQTELPGGLRAFERLEDFLDESPLEYDAHGTTKKVSMSCCVAEPVADDDLDTLLENLREDTQDVDRSQGASAFTFREISPLQRFIES